MAKLKYYDPSSGTYKELGAIMEGPRGPQGLKGDTGDAGTPGGSVLTTKGDIAIRDASGNVRFPASSIEGKYLISDPTKNEGLAWAGPIGNLLTANVASGTDTLGDTTGFGNAYQCTIASSTASPIRGARSLRVTATGATPGVYGQPLTTCAPVTPGQVYTVSARAVSSGTLKPFVSIRFYTSGGANLGDTVGSPLGAGAAGTVTVTATAPATAAYATFVLGGNTATVGNTCDWDDLGLWAGAGGDWAMPGTPITNLGHRVTHPNTDDVLVQKWDAGKGAWQTVHYDSGWRALVVTSGGSVTSGAFGSTDWGANTNAGFVHVRRTDSLVTMRIQWAEAKASSPTGNIVTLTSGFRGGSGTQQVVVHVQNTVPNVFNMAASINGIARTQGTCALGDCIGRFGAVNVSWTTDDAIPTSLPGTLVSAAPA